MINVVGVRFQNTGKSYYFDPLEYELKRGMHVIVETQRGREFGTITIPPILVQDDKVVQPLRPILRIATEEDEKRNAENREKSKEAGKICIEKIHKYGLEMKLVETEYTFDRSKLLFYFTADGRVDFRELVKDLASVFRTRIELRQIGVRDETKIKGGLGMCGRELCCTTFLSDFAPVSIRMAKEQNLSLNPSKISGACGRLMCCLKNEQETYEYLNKQLPKQGMHVKTIDELEGTVSSVNILKQTVKVMLDMNGDKEIREYAVGELAYGEKGFTCEPRRRPQDDLDYFSEQLKLAVAAVHDPDEEKREKDEKNRGRNRNSKSRNNRKGAGRQESERRQGDQEHKSEGQKQRGGSKSGEQKQHGDGQQNAGNKQGGEKRRQNERRRNKSSGENRKNPDGSGVNDQHSQNAERADGRSRQGRKPNTGKQGGGKQNTLKNAGGKPNTGKQSGEEKQNAAGEGNTQQEKSTRSRSRNRSRANKNREGKPQNSGDGTQTKQSDS